MQTPLDKGFHRVKNGNNETNHQVGKNYLLIIAIDEYKDKKISNLNNAVRDAKTIKEELLKRYHFDSDHSLELVNNKATKKNIIDCFRKLIKICNDTDSLIVYYSGHGYFDEDFNHGFCFPMMQSITQLRVTWKTPF